MAEMNIGIVGIGRWGKNYLRTITTLNNSRVFIADANPDVLVNLNSYPDIDIITFDDMLADSKIKAMIIATPDRTHYQLACQALQQGKDVLVEKPMAIHPNEAHAMLKLSQERELILAVGHTAVYTPGFEKLQYLIATNSLGRILHAEAIRTSRGRDEVDIFNDLLPHCLAMTIKLWGEPVAVSLKEITKNRVLYQMNFAGGEVLNGTACWQEPPFIRRFVVFGSKQSAICDEPTGDILHFNNLPLTRECRDFISCCRTRKTPISDGTLGLKVTQSIYRLKMDVKKHQQSE